MATGKFERGGVNPGSAFLPIDVFNVPEIDKVETVGQLVNFVCNCLGIKDCYPDNMVDPGFIPPLSYFEIWWNKSYDGDPIFFPLKLRVKRSSVTMVYHKYLLWWDGFNCDELIQAPSESCYYNVVYNMEGAVGARFNGFFHDWPSVKCIDIECADGNTFLIKVWIVANGIRSSCFEIPIPRFELSSFFDVVSDLGSRPQYEYEARRYIASRVFYIVSDKLPKRQLLQSVGIDFDKVQQRRAEKERQKEQQKERRRIEEERKARHRLKVMIIAASILVLAIAVGYSKKRNQENNGKIKYQNAKIVKQRLCNNQNTISY